MKRNRLLVRDHKTVLDMFEMGLSQSRIANAMNVPYGAVVRVIREKFPEHRGRQVMLPDKEIAKKYKSGATMDSLAKEYNTTIKTIKSRLEDLDIDIIPQAVQRRVHSYNEDYFGVIDSSEKAYWLGFMFADGSISATRKDVSISLKHSDEPHLHKLCAALSYRGPGAVTTVDGSGFSGPEHKSARLTVRSGKMWSDLVAHGCIPNKSLDLSGPSGLPDEFAIDFIRGVVDGDGYISGVGHPSLEIVGAYELLSWIADICELQDPRPHKSIWRIRCSGAEAADLAGRLYYDGCVSLDRKHARAQAITLWQPQVSRVSKVEVDEVMSMHRSGVAAKKISETLGREKSTIYKVIQREQ